MAYEKTYRTVVPVEHDADHDQLMWLARESFEKTAASDGLSIVEYGEREVPVSEIPPETEELLGRALTDFIWFEFTGLGRLDEELMDWFTAECAWKNSQLKEWVAAERIWRAGEAKRAQEL